MITFTKPTITKKDLTQVLECMLSDKIGNGELTRKLGRGLGEFVGSQHVILYNSKEVALFMLLHHLGLGVGDEVLIPAYGDPFILEVLAFLKITPVFVDLKTDSYGMDLEKAEALIGEKTRALVVSHLFGFPVEIPETLLGKENLTIIEDVSHGLGSREQSVQIGLKGHFGLFSLDSESLITTAQGGFLVCRQKKDYDSLREKKTSGFPDTILGRLEVGLSDLQAALGLSELSLSEKFLVRRKEIGDYYRESLRRGINRVLDTGEERKSQDLWFPVQMAGGLKSALDFFKKYKIEAIEPYPKCLFEFAGKSDEEFPHSKKVRLKTLCVPIYPVLKKDAVEEIGKLLANIR